MTSTDIEQPAGDPIQARRVPIDDRTDLLVRHFGSLQFAMVVDVQWQMRETCSNYGGGSWHCHELSNGGFYMAPVIEENCRVRIKETGFDGEMSADAVGIVACLTALSGPSRQTIEAHLHALRAFAAEHAERNLIFAAIGEALPETTTGTRITPDWLRRYAKGDAECPCCSGSLEGREITIEGDQASQEVNCTQCGYSFSAVYDFKYIAPNDTEDNNGESIHLEDGK